MKIHGYRYAIHNDRKYKVSPEGWAFAQRIEAVYDPARRVRSRAAHWRMIKPFFLGLTPAAAAPCSSP